MRSPVFADIDPETAVDRLAGFAKTYEAGGPDSVRSREQLRSVLSIDVDDISVPTMLAVAVRGYGTAFDHVEDGGSKGFEVRGRAGRDSVLATATTLHLTNKVEASNFVSLASAHGRLPYLRSIDEVRLFTEGGLTGRALSRHNRQTTEFSADSPHLTPDHYGLFLQTLARATNRFLRVVEAKA